MRRSSPWRARKSESSRGSGCGGLGGLVKGSQQVTALEEVQVALQWHIDLTIVTGQLRQTGGLKRRAKQTAGDTWKMTERERMIGKVHMGNRCFIHSPFSSQSGLRWFIVGQLTLALVRWQQVILSVVAPLFWKGLLVCSIYHISSILTLPVLQQTAEIRRHAAWHHPPHLWCQHSENTV